jgi:hypothetical protein
MRLGDLLAGLALLLIGSFARAQPVTPDVTGEVRAISLQSNVVKIVATLTQGGVPQLGFGFIVGQQSNQLVVVTADHVVRGQDASGRDVEDRSPVITFYESQGFEVRGALQSVRMPKDHGDLAVILVPRQDFVRYDIAALSEHAPARGMPVWLVGRGGAWNIPTAPGIVAGYDPFGLRIKIENLPAGPGSSGGPLISADGIVGMIVVDGGLATEATPIEPIQRQVRDAWRYDWRLATAHPTLSARTPIAAAPAVTTPVVTVPAVTVPAVTVPRPEAARQREIQKARELLGISANVTLQRWTTGACNNSSKTYVAEVRDGNVIWTSRDGGVDIESIGLSDNSDLQTTTESSRHPRGNTESYGTQWTYSDDNGRITVKRNGRNAFVLTKCE